MLSISSNLNDTIIWVRRTVTFIIKMITKTSPSFWIAATSVSLGLQLTAGTSGTLQKYFWRFQTFFMFFRQLTQRCPNPKIHDKADVLFVLDQIRNFDFLDCFKYFSIFNSFMKYLSSISITAAFRFVWLTASHKRCFHRSFNTLWQSSNLVET